MAEAVHAVPNTTQNAIGWLNIKDDTRIQKLEATTSRGNSMNPHQMIRITALKYVTKTHLAEIDMADRSERRERVRVG